MELWPHLHSVAHLDGSFSLSGVCQRVSCIQRTAFQLGIVPSVPQGRLNRDIQDIEGIHGLPQSVHSMI